MHIPKYLKYLLLLPYFLLPHTTHASQLPNTQTTCDQPKGQLDNLYATLEKVPTLNTILGIQNQKQAKEQVGKIIKEATQQYQTLQIINTQQQQQTLFILKDQVKRQRIIQKITDPQHPMKTEAYLSFLISTSRQNKNQQQLNILKFDQTTLQKNLATQGEQLQKYHENGVANHVASHFLLAGDLGIGTYELFTYLTKAIYNRLATKKVPNQSFPLLEKEQQERKAKEQALQKFINQITQHKTITLPNLTIFPPKKTLKTLDDNKYTPDQQRKAIQAWKKKLRSKIKNLNSLISQTKHTLSINNIYRHLQQQIYQQTQHQLQNKRRNILYTFLTPKENTQKGKKKIQQQKAQAQQLKKIEPEKITTLQRIQEKNPYLLSLLDHTLTHKLIIQVLS